MVVHQDGDSSIVRRVATGRGIGGSVPVNVHGVLALTRDLMQWMQEAKHVRDVVAHCGPDTALLANPRSLLKTTLQAMGIHAMLYRDQLTPLLSLRRYNRAPQATNPGLLTVQLKHLVSKKRTSADKEVKPPKHDGQPPSMSSLWVTGSKLEETSITGPPSVSTLLMTADLHYCCLLPFLEGVTLYHVPSGTVYTSNNVLSLLEEGEHGTYSVDSSKEDLCEKQARFLSYLAMTGIYGLAKELLPPQDALHLVHELSFAELVASEFHSKAWIRVPNALVNRFRRIRRKWEKQLDVLGNFVAGHLEYGPDEHPELWDYSLKTPRPEFARYSPNFQQDVAGVNGGQSLATWLHMLGMSAEEATELTKTYAQKSGVDITPAKEETLSGSVPESATRSEDTESMGMFVMGFNHPSPADMYGGEDDLVEDSLPEPVLPEPVLPKTQNVEVSQDVAMHTPLVVGFNDEVDPSLASGTEGAHEDPIFAVNEVDVELFNGTQHSIARCLGDFQQWQEENLNPGDPLGIHLEASVKSRWDITLGSITSMKPEKNTLPHTMPFLGSALL